MASEQPDHDSVPADEHVTSRSAADEIKADEIKDVVADHGADEALDRDPFEELASEFAERHRLGDMPSVEEYAEKYPELADEIRDLFPTIAAMEQLKERKGAPQQVTLGGLPLEQLGDFRILGEIGRGGMGVVYEAEQVSLGRHVAVKVLPKQALLDERQLRRFEREAQTAAKLHHTNIVPVFGVGQQDGYHYIVMQFIPGVGIDEILVALRTLVLDDDSARFRMDSSNRASHANHNAKALLDGNFSKHTAASFASSFVKGNAGLRSGTQPIHSDAAATVEIVTTATEANASMDSSSSGPENTLGADESAKLKSIDKAYYQSVARIGQQVADALAYAHEQGTLHRDIKPGNLLLDGTGTVWVADFGLAKLTEQDHLSRSGDIVGTLSYMPPESFSGDTDARGDIYALGLTLYEMLALRPAYFGRDRGKLVRQITDGDLPRLAKLNPSVPRDLETIILKAIEHRPEDRYATARELEEDLERFRTDMPIRARRMSVPEQFTRWCRKNKLVASLSAAVLSLLVVSSLTFGFLTWQANSAKNDALAQTQVADEQRTLAVKREGEANAAGNNAKEMAKEALNAWIILLNTFIPDRLPLSADQSLQTASLAEVALEDGELTEDDSEAAEIPTAAFVAAAPVTAEIAAKLPQILASVDSLAKRAGDDKELAPTFANLMIRIGKLHKMLGKHEVALEYFENGIARYEDIVRSSNSPSAIVGLASSYNEKGDVIALNANRFEAFQAYRSSLALLQQHQDILADSPRAKYEHARTLFLMSVQRRSPDQPGGPGGPRPPGFGRGRGGRGRPAGGQAGRSGERRPPEWLGGPIRDPISNLKEAIGLLEPLVKSETNPEYRYLLARCYSGLSLANRRDRNQQQEDIEKALKLFEALVESQPDVADYRFELAIAKFFSLDIKAYTADERLRVAGEIAALTDEISSKNPGVSDYALLNARALLTFADAMDRQADHVERNGGADLVAFRTASEQAISRAGEALKSARERFPKAMDDAPERMPSDEDFEIIRQRVTVKHDIARAKDLKRNGDEAGFQALLQEAQAEMRTVVTKEVTRSARLDFRRPDTRSRRLFESVGLLVQIEAELSGTASAKKLLQTIKQDRLAALRQQQESELSDLDGLEIDLHIARTLKSIDPQAANDLLEDVQQELMAIPEVSWPRRRLNPEEQARVFQFMISRGLLFETYKEAGNERGLQELRQKLMSRMRREGGGRGQGPPPPRGPDEPSRRPE